jgi:regulator of protease activity HflC (stomatin/prohibitin superfamily)
MTNRDTHTKETITMTEKILSTKKNGMAMMMFFILLYLVAFAGIPLGANMGGGAGIGLSVLAGLWVTVGWVPFLGLKVLRPQEALVLTLFGKYKGTLKGDGFYWVNPFCS